MSKQQIWMLSTAPAGKGGIATVIRQYQQAGLFDNGAMRLLVSHHDRSKWGRVLPFLRACWTLWPALCLGRVSLVHAHTSHGGSFWRKLILLAPAFLLRVPVVVHLHGSDFESFHADGSRWRQSCIRFMLRRSFRVLALSTEWRQWVLRVEPNARVDVLFNSLSSATEQGADALVLGAVPTALFLGRIGDRKGTFDLLQAFARVLERLPEARLVIGGDGEVDKLHAEVARLGLAASVEFAGWVNTERKEQLFHQAWLFALPSYHEGLPMAILEAMARSRAVVSCPIGGIAEAVQAELTGLLRSPGDIPGLAQALLTILGDRQCAERMGAEGRKAFLAKFSHQANLPKLLALYRQAGLRDVPELSASSDHSALAESKA